MRLIKKVCKKKERVTETPKIYKNNLSIFLDIKKEALNILQTSKNKVIDLGSDKPPQFALRIAREYPETQITHFKDTKTIGKIEVDYKSDNLTYAFKPRKLKKSFFDIATAFFTLHEFPEKQRINELKILYRSLKSKGIIINIDYNLPWVQKGNLNEIEFVEEVFTEDNEKKVMKTELRCMQTHTSYGLEDCVEDCSNIGFKEVYSRNYHIQTSQGIKPKIFLYLGKKI